MYRVCFPESLSFASCPPGTFPSSSCNPGAEAIRGADMQEDLYVAMAEPRTRQDLPRPHGVAPTPKDHNSLPGGPVARTGEDLHRPVVAGNAARQAVQSEPGADVLHPRPEGRPPQPDRLWPQRPSREAAVGPHICCRS